VKQHNWMSLSEAYKQLREKFRDHHGLLDELLSNAITSGLVLFAAFRNSKHCRS
jgi:hypothetical protein